MAFSALEALQAFGAGREMAMQDRPQRRSETQLDRLTTAYNPQSGRFDPTAARLAYLEGGDLQGLRQFDQAENQFEEADLEQHRDRIVQGARFLEGVSDEATYQQARRDAGAFGIDLSDVPDTYDPAYVDSLRRAAASFTAQPSQQQVSGIARELQDAGYTPGTPQFNEAMRGVINNKYASEYVDENNNTRRRSALNLGPPQAASAPPQAIEALRRGEGSPAQFDEIFGAGAAARAMGMQGPAPETGANGAPTRLTRQQYQAIVNAKGRAETDAYIARNGIQVDR